MTFLGTVANDMAYFFADFGIEATFSNGATTHGIFDRGYLEIAIGDAGQEGRNPEFHFPSKDLPTGYSEGDTITIDGKVWAIKNLLQDETGVTICELEE